MRKKDVKIINSNQIFGITGFVGGLCSILVVVDTYLLKSKIVSSLSLPITVPIGILALIILVMCIIIVLAARLGIRKLPPSLPQSLEQQNKMVESLRIKADKLQAENSRLNAELQINTSLKTKVLAILEGSHGTINSILSSLDMAETKADKDHILSALGKLIEEGKVIGSGGYYYTCTKGVPF